MGGGEIIRKHFLIDVILQSVTEMCVL